MGPFERRMRLLTSFFEWLGRHITNAGEGVELIPGIWIKE
jgi:hypothetical protein